MGFLKARVNMPKSNVKFNGCIYVGVPKSKSELVKGKNDGSRREFTNADILFVLEHGSPVRNIVPRPLISYVLRIHEKEITDALYGAIPLILSGKEEEVDVYFEKLALKIQGWVQMFMVHEGQLIWKPSIRVLKAKSKGKDAKTMIDTGSLRQSIIAFYSKDGKD